MSTNRTHLVHLVDLAQGGSVHAEVRFVERGQHRFQWRATCLVCDDQSSHHPDISTAVAAAFEHGIQACKA